VTADFGQRTLAGMVHDRRPSRVGEVLGGKYRLDALLGAGGMGEIYRAENTGLGRNVAIKLMLEEHAGNADTVARFLREARAASIVRHPNVVDVLDVAQADDGTPFIVQELLDGNDLAQYVYERGGKLAPRQAIEILLPVVDAIAFAHQRGVIHRDLKPENVFLARGPTGQITPKLLDFGISRIVSADFERMTATGTTVGTPAYMSPEQVRADVPIDARTDVWALGVILFEIVSGARPFQADSPGALFLKIATEDARPLFEVAPEVSRALSDVVAKCLQPIAAKRYAAAADVARDLRSVLDSGGGEVCDTEPGYGPFGEDAAAARPPAVAPAAIAPPPPAALPSFAFLPRVPSPAQPAPRQPGPPQPGPSLPVPSLLSPIPGPSAISLAPLAPSVANPYAPTGAVVARSSPDAYAPMDPILGSDRPIDLASEPPGMPPLHVRPGGPAAIPDVQAGTFYFEDPKIARAPPRRRRQDAESRLESGLPRLVGSGIIFGIVLVLTGIGATFLSGTLPVVAWARTLDGLASWASSGATSLAVVLGFAALVFGARARPVSWGLVVAAIGLLIDGVGFAGFVFPSLPRLSGTATMNALAQLAFAWATGLVAVGVAMVLVRQAWQAWSSDTAGRGQVIAIAIVLATAALLCAVAIVRGAS
jgi:serine/threonine protein kinase